MNVVSSYTILQTVTPNKMGSEVTQFPVQKGNSTVSIPELP